MPDPVKNFARCLVDGLYSSGALEVTLQTGEGAKLPQPSTEGAFDLVWWNNTDYPNPSDDPYKEIVRVQARTSDVITIERAQQGTTATAKNIADKDYIMGLMPTKRTEDYQNGKEHAYAPSGAGTTTIDLSLAKINKVTMPAAAQTLALSNVEIGQLFIIEIINTTGQGALTWFSTIKWPDGSVPGLTGTNGKKDTFGFRCTAAGQYDGYIIGLNL